MVDVDAFYFILFYFFLHNLVNIVVLFHSANQKLYTIQLSCILLYYYNFISNFFFEESIPTTLIPNISLKMNKNKV
ncbi:MAG: hypothetical protein Q8835_03060, partial [Sweet potato little leaf phytoplasma]|nr:hypothetical protein [Sweet potato little leaf phytoplasma]